VAESGSGNGAAVVVYQSLSLVIAGLVPAISIRRVLCVK
jgi:hypothetical protein